MRMSRPNFTKVEKHFETKPVAEILKKKLCVENL